MRRLACFISILLLLFLLCSCVEEKEARCGSCGSTKNLYSVPTNRDSYICRKCMIK